MGKIVKRTKKPVLPLYAGGLALVAGAALFPVYRLWGLSLMLALGAAAYLAMARLAPLRVEQREVSYATGVEEADLMLASLETELQKLAAVNASVPDQGLSAAMTRMERAGRGIMAELEKNPQKARSVRRFAGIYLPETVKILTAFARMEAAGAQGQNAADIRAEVETNAAGFASAFENQLDALYADTALDISVDVNVLNGLLRAQGLAGEAAPGASEARA